jgi:predicted RND superfamily exporter protein
MSVINTIIGRLVTRYNSWILATTLVITVASVILLPRIRTDTDFKQFLPKGEPALTAYEAFTKQTGSSEHVLVIAVINKPSVFEAIFLKRLQGFQARIDSMSGVDNTSSLLSLRRYKQMMPGIFSGRPYLQAEKFIRDSVIIFKDLPLTQHFITKDATVTKILVRLSETASLNAVDSLIKKIDRAASVFPAGSVHILGRKYIESEYKKLVNHEMGISLTLSITFIILILFILHRSFAGVVLPLLCMVVSLIMLFGYMAIFNRTLTIMSNMLPTIVLIVGISDVIHISSKFAYESLRSASPEAAIQTTLKEIGLTTFINSFTTAIGFLTLLTMSMEALRSFGVDAAVGLMIAWANSFFLLPAMLVRFNLAKSFSRPVESRLWHNMLSRVLTITQTYPKSILLFFGVALIISFGGILHINTNNFVLTSLPEKNRLLTDFQFFDAELGGGRSFEVIISARGDSRMSHQPVIESIARLEDYLKENCGVTEIISPAWQYQWLNQLVHDDHHWKLPATQKEYNYLSTFVHAKENNLPIQLIDSSGTMGRFYGRIKDTGRRNIEQLYKPMQAWIQQNTDTSIVKFEITGPDYITDIGHQLRIDNMTGSFLLEIVLVSAIIGLIYRSPKIVLISFIANIIPVIFVGGVMGFLGIELRGATTAIFAIGYVIAVDDTLHFVNRFQLEKRKGLTTSDALSQTVLHTGRAMVMTSLILSGGFLILLHSSFGDVFMHGFLVSLIIFAALVTELLITPVLITYFFRENIQR